MKRSHIVVFFLGILVAVISNHALLFIHPVSEAKADIPTSSLGKPYPLTFGEYLDLFLATQTQGPSYYDEQTGFFVVIEQKLTERGLRVRLTGDPGTANAKSEDKQTQKRLIESLDRLIKSKIGLWKEKGFDIVEGDIEIDPKLK